MSKREGENQEEPNAKRQKLDENSTHMVELVLPIHIVEPEVPEVSEWVRALGHNLIENIELKVGDVTIAKLRHCHNCGHTHDDTVPGLTCVYYQTRHELLYGTSFPRDIKDLLPKNK